MISVPYSYNYVSFDVFDTLVTRKYIKPSDLFKDLEIQVLLHYGRGTGFATVRTKAEFELRQKVRFQTEVTINEIYSLLKTKLDFSHAEIEQIKSWEIALELQSIVPIRETLLAILELRKRNIEVLFISDIYLPEQFLKTFLKNFDIYREGDSLYASSEHRSMKHTGELFKHVLSDLKIAPAEMCHIGDNIESDVRAPERLGIRSIHYTGTLSNRYENFAAEELIVSKFIGASKATRKQGDATKLSEKVIWNTTANISAPIVFTFVNWCIQTALREGVTTLYFLSRDGQIMYEVAKIIVEKYYHDRVTLKYLYVSRQSLLFPAIEDLDEDAFEWIFAPTSMLTIRIILDRVNFEIVEMLPSLEQHGLHQKLDTQLNSEDIETLKIVLLSNKRLILERAAKFRENALEYFTQEGMFRSTRFAVVDIGWNGTLQRSISKILSSKGYLNPVFGMYFGVRRRKLFKSTDVMLSWFTDERNRRPLDEKVYIVPMTELFTAADHGGVVRYERRGDTAYPVLKSEVNHSGVSWGILTQHAAIIEFAKHLLSMLSPAELKGQSEATLGLIEANYEKFLLSPDADEAMVYCAYEDAEDQNEAYRVRMGTPYTLVELHSYFSDDFMHHHNEWRQGSLALTDQRLVSYAWNRFRRSVAQ